MSSISTLIFRKAELDSRALYQKPSYYVGFMSWCLWTFAAIVAAATTESSANGTGLSLTFKVQDVLVMLLTTYALIRGISGGNPYLVYPWVALSSMNIYSYQYPRLVQMMTKLGENRYISVMAHVVFGMEVISIAIKTMLIVQVVKLSINIWYQRKLQCETIAKN